jgi:hypothetical protein
MDVLVTSFGLTPFGVRGKHRRSIFDRMPPTALDLTGQFLMPDYAVLLLCDRIVVDSEMFDRLTHAHHWSYNRVAETMRVLHSEGYLRLDNYSERLNRERASIKRKVQEALEVTDWSEALERSEVIWHAFLNAVRESAAVLRRRSGRNQTPLAVELDRFISARLHEGGAVELTDTVWREQVAARPEFERIALAANLAYIESNIELSRQLGVPIYDWADYKPFYDTRLRYMEQDQFDKTAKEVRQLFNVSFPDFAPLGWSRCYAIDASRPCACW